MKTAIPKSKPVDLPRSAIRVDPTRNSRSVVDDGLVEKIRKDGMITAVTVARASDGKYDLVAGFRRMKAADILGMDPIPATVLDEHVDTRFANYSENIDRTSLPTYDEAILFRGWRDDLGMTYTQIAARIGKSISYVSQRVKLLETLHDDLIAVWRDADAPGLFYELVDMHRLPKEKQLIEFNVRRNIREAFAAKGIPQERVPRRTNGAVGRRMGTSQCIRFLEKRLPRAHLPPETKEYIDATVRYMLGLTSRLPYRIGRPEPE